MSSSRLQSRKSPEDQASEWAARLGRGALSLDETEALGAWMDLEPGHRLLLDGELALQARLRTAVPEMVRSGRLRIPRRRKVAPGTAWTAGMAATIAIGLGILWFANRPKELSTPFAQRQSIAFSDGSVADLNANTELSVKLGRDERHVRLTRGEAYFSVAKDPSRPFFVETPAGTVRVTGTRFDVRAVDPGSLEVTVLEGSVQVSTPSAEPAALQAQDQLTAQGGALSTHRLSSEAAKDSVAWRDGQIVFDGAALSYAVGRFTQYDGRDISVASQVASLRVGGTFRLDDLDGFLRDISTAIPVKVQKAADGSIRIVQQ